MFWLAQAFLTTQLESDNRRKEPRPGAWTRTLCSNAEFQLRVLSGRSIVARLWLYK